MSTSSGVTTICSGWVLLSGTPPAWPTLYVSPCAMPTSPRWRMATGSTCFLWRASLWRSMARTPVHPSLLSSAMLMRPTMRRAFSSWGRCTRRSPSYSSSSSIRSLRVTPSMGWRIVTFCTASTRQKERLPSPMERPIPSRIPSSPPLTPTIPTSSPRLRLMS